MLKGVDRPEDLLGDIGLMKELKIRLMKRMSGAELTAHLGYEDGKEVPPGQANCWNGTSTEVLKGQGGEMPVAVPRDRDRSFEPELVKKGQPRINRRSDGAAHPGASVLPLGPEGIARSDQPGGGHSIKAI